MHRNTFLANVLLSRSIGLCFVFLYKKQFIDREPFDLYSLRTGGGYEEKQENDDQINMSK